MPHPYFDSRTYRFEGAGQEFYDGLSVNVTGTADIQKLYMAVWQNAADFPRPDPFTAAGAWREILIRTSLALRLRQLCDAVLAENRFAGLHELAQAIHDAPDPLEEEELGNDKLFLDRKRLRSSLKHMSATKPVLVVRGHRRSGKSWTRKMIKAAFHPADAFIEVDAQLNYKFNELIVRIMKKIDPGGSVPASLTTTAASHRDILFEMLGSMEQKPKEKRQRLWIIVDDLNEPDDCDP